MKKTVERKAVQPATRIADAVTLFRADGPVRVIVADDRRFCRECLRLLIETFDPDLEVVEAGDPSEVSDLLREHPGFSVVLYNLVVRGAEGVDYIAKLHQLVPDIPLIVLCDHEDPEIMRGAMASGAKAFLPATTPSPVVMAVLRLVIAGGTYAPPEMVLAESPRSSAKNIGDRGQENRESLIAAQFPELTPRQRSVLALLSQGQMNRDIARTLGMRENTVKAHVKQVMRKLNAGNRTQAALMADRLVV